MSKKRQYTDKERKMTEKILKRRKEDLKILNDNYNYNKALIEKQKFMREFDDRWREYLRIQKDKEDEKVLKLIMSEIADVDETIKVTENQMKYGVEKKLPVGVN